MTWKFRCRDLRRMEFNGIAVDVATLEEQLKTFIGQVAKEEEAARELAEDPTLNLRARSSCKWSETFGMPKTKKTKTGYSTAAAKLKP